MTEEAAQLAFAIIVILGCGFGLFVVCLPQIDRLVERWKKKRT